MSVLTEARSHLQPSDDDIRDEVVSILQNHLEGASAQIGGSVAKGTHSGSDYDIDIFIKYEADNNISDDLERVLKGIGWSYRRVQASRDYFIVNDNHDYELVPVLDIDDPADAETVIDISPLHVDYFNERATQGQKDDVRLLKQFMKAHHVYGAESHIGGFSGHVVDLLILAYGSFMDVLDAAASWEAKTVIDIEEHHDTPMLTLNESKTHGPLIVVDPIQAERNAAAAVTEASFNTFKDAASSFKANPSIASFHTPSLQERVSTTRDNTPKGSQTAVIDVRFEDERNDVSGAKLVKLKSFLERRLNEADFDVHKAITHHEDKSAIVLAASSTPRNDRHEIIGPPLHLDEHIERFKEEHDEVAVKDTRAVAYEPNPYDYLEDALQALLGDEYVTDRCSSTVLRELH